MDYICLLLEPLKWWPFVSEQRADSSVRLQLMCLAVFLKSQVLSCQVHYCHQCFDHTNLCPTLSHLLPSLPLTNSPCVSGQTSLSQSSVSWTLPPQLFPSLSFSWAHNSSWSTQHHHNLQFAFTYAIHCFISRPSTWLHQGRQLVCFVHHCLLKL